MVLSSQCVCVCTNSMLLGMMVGYICCCLILLVISEIVDLVGIITTYNAGFKQTDSIVDCVHVWIKLSIPT